MTLRESGGALKKLFHDVKVGVCLVEKGYVMLQLLVNFVYVLQRVAL